MQQHLHTQQAIICLMSTGIIIHFTELESRSENIYLMTISSYSSYKKKLQIKVENSFLQFKHNFIMDKTILDKLVKISKYID